MRSHQARSYGPNVNTHDHTTDAWAGTSIADHDQRQHNKVRPEASAIASIMDAVNGGASGWPALDWAAAEASAHHSDLGTSHLEAGDTAAAVLRAGRGNALVVFGRRHMRRHGGRSVVRTVHRLAQGPVAIIRTTTTRQPRADS